MALNHACRVLPEFVWNVDPVLLRFSGLEFRYYGLLLEGAILLGFSLFSWQIRRGQGAGEEAGEFLIIGTPALLIGARIAHCVFYDLDHLLANPTWLLKIGGGGLASHGAAIGLALAMYVFTRRRAIPFLDGTDRLTFATALAVVLVRCGNWFNSEIAGRVTDGTWGVAFPRYDMGGDVPLRHPAQLYEAALGVLLFGALLVCDRAWAREGRARGALTGVLLVGYFSGRFLLEFVKEPEGPRFGWLDMGQVLSLPAIACGVFVLWRSLRTPLPAGWVVGRAPTRALQVEEDS